MPRRAPSIRSRLLPLAVGAVLAGGLATTLGAGPAGGVEARPGGARLAVRTTRMEPAGRAVVRDLARRDAVVRPTLVEAPRRGGWDRPGQVAVGGRGRPGAGEPLTAAAAASIGPVAGPGPSVAGQEAAAGPGPSVAGLAPAATGGPGIVSPAWDGMTDEVIPCGTSRPCFEPPDPWVAVSATHVVQMVGQATRITNRSGGAAITLSNRTFFGVSAWSAGAFIDHPRVVFDPGHDRWLATLFAGTCSAGALFVAVSRTADPAGAWDRYFRAFPGRWPDYPTLGFSSTLVAVGVNERVATCADDGAYLGASLRVMDWADLLDGDAPAIVSTTPLAAAFTYAPAAGLTAGDDLHAVVALDDGTTSSADLGYLGVTGSAAGGTVVVSAPVVVAGLPLGKLRQPPTPIDAGGLIGVQANALDLRPTDAAWRAGRLLVASTTRCLRGTSYRPCGRVTELTTQADLGPPSVRQDLALVPTAGYTDSFVPGAAYADDGTIWTVFSQSSSGRYVSSWARRQVPGDPVGAWSAGAALLALGRGPYGGTAGAGLNARWGDAVGVARDPAQPGSAWQANQLADTGGGWATRVGRLGDDATPPSVGPPRPSFVAGSQAGTVGVPVRIAWTLADGGSGVASVRLERSVNEGPFVPVTLSSSTAREVIQTLAYGARYAYRVTASDNAGNALPAPVDGPAFVPTVYSEGSTRVAYAGSWLTSRTSSHLGGAARYASVAGRRATFTLTGLAVAWVSTAARSRGSARVYADGVQQGTYSTYRTVAMYRRVVTGRTFAEAGTHTYRVEVVGTPGHPRIDVDAFIVLR